MERAAAWTEQTCSNSLQIGDHKRQTVVADHPCHIRSLLKDGVSEASTHTTRSECIPVRPCAASMTTVAWWFALAAAALMDSSANQESSSGFSLRKSCDRNCYELTRSCVSLRWSAAYRTGGATRSHRGTQSSDIAGSSGCMVWGSDPSCRSETKLARRTRFRPPRAHHHKLKSEPIISSIYALHPYPREAKHHNRIVLHDRKGSAPERPPYLHVPCLILGHWRHLKLEQHQHLSQTQTFVPHPKTRFGHKRFPLRGGAEIPTTSSRWYC